MKRLTDIVLSIIGLVILSPIFFIFMLLIWLQDFSSPLFIAPRVGRGGKIFAMVKLRSMVVNADKSGVDSTAVDDKRITWIGQLIRRYKIDEISQLWNVLCGHMSLVGPRPNVQRDVALYTEEEQHLLDVRPGITDFASIVFSDEGQILAGSSDPDLKYNQVIRPWKSRFGLFYINNRSFILDMQIILFTVIAILSRAVALRGVKKLVESLGANDKLVKIALRREPLYPYQPPGSDKTVMSRDREANNESIIL
jgi:lipopolysaccharide/colanic/teichoic acid biosynthesis glycosyltransferase